MTSPDSGLLATENRLMQFGVLGPLRVEDGERTIEISRPRERAVLAALLVEANAVVPLDRLVDQIYGGAPPPRAIGSLHAYISNLRRLLEPTRPPRAPATVLVSRPPGYSLQVDPQDIDAVRFERIVAAARRIATDEPAAALLQYDEALGLWRGPAYADVAYDDFAAAAIRRLDELRAAALDERIEALLALGRSDEAVPELEALLLDDALHERRWGLLVVALYRSGRQADALAAYRRAQHALDELGLEPSPELRRLEHAVLTHSPDLASPPVRPSRAPAQVTPSTSAGRSDELLLGRGDELDRLAAVLDDVRRGRGASVLIRGEPGIGKTTLAGELLRRASAAGAMTGVGRWPESRTAPPMWPWLQIARQLTNDRLPMEITEPLAAVEAGSAGAQPRLLSGLLGAIRAAAVDAPAVLFLDDMQWADEPSLRMLQLAITDVSDSAVLLVVTMREPVEPDAVSLGDTLAMLARSPGAAQLSLRGLDRADTARLVAGLTHAEHVDDEVVTAVHARTGGNPFFATELVRLLAAEHALDARAMAATAVPTGVRDVVRRRVARLPQQAHAVLTIAAVAGPDVDGTVVEQVAGIDEDTLVDLFELATVAGVLTERPDRPGVYRFGHDLVREAVYEGLPGLRRSRLHQRVADAIVSVRGDNKQTAHELARHAVAAVAVCGAAPAVARLILSARVALGELSLGLAEQQLQRAMDLIDTMPASAERDRFEVQVQARLGQLAFHNRSDPVEADARHRHALRLCDPNDIRQLGGVLIGIGSYAPLTGDFDEAVAVGRRLLALVARTEDGDVELRAAAHYLCAMAAWAGPERVDEALVEIDAALSAATGAGRQPDVWSGIPVPVMHAYRSLLLAWRSDERWVDAAAHAIDAAVLARDDWGLAWSAAFAGLAGTAAGDAETTERLVETALTRAARLDYTDAVFRGCAAWAAARQGADARTAAETIRQAADDLAAMGDAMFRPHLVRLAASVDPAAVTA